jgi:hypothetical protein
MKRQSCTQVQTGDSTRAGFIRRLGCYFQNSYSSTRMRRSTKGLTVVTTVAKLYLNVG